MVVGFLFAFLPLLGLTGWWLHALWGVWGAKAAMNLVRLGGSVIRIHTQVLRQGPLIEEDVEEAVGSEATD